MKQRIFFMVIALFIGWTTNAQVKVVDPKKVTEKSVSNAANSDVNQTVNSGVNSVNNVVKSGLKGLFKKKSSQPQQTGNSTEAGQATNENQAVTSSSTVNKENSPSLRSFTQYDFVPGDKILLYEDFSQDAVGDFPALWTTDVAGEINTLNIATGNWFNLNSTEGTYWLMKEIDFPKNFILEMDIVPKPAAPRYAADIVFFGEEKHSEMDKNGDPGTCGLHVLIAKSDWETRGYKRGAQERLTGLSTNNLVVPGKVNHVIIWVQNRRVRIYNAGGKVLDVPTNIYEGSKFSRLCFKLYRGASSGSYISNIKITTATPDTRNKLLTEGKLVTYGIYFDVNKDIVKPESYGTLKDIAKTLNEVPDVKVKIVGHTDNDGADAANLDLSKRRAASVKTELSNMFGVNADRLVTDGMGETKPVAPNDTPANKALNRRVEFIKM
jgi:outer membrane protein OmpA-like peptidoglycan-associated protein